MNASSIVVKQGMWRWYVAGIWQTDRQCSVFYWKLPFLWTKGCVFSFLSLSSVCQNEIIVLFFLLLLPKLLPPLYFPLFFFSRRNYSKVWLWPVPTEAGQLWGPWQPPFPSDTGAQWEPSGGATRETVQIHPNVSQPVESSERRPGPGGPARYLPLSNLRTFTATGK